jgi:hypothetical protein
MGDSGVREELRRVPAIASQLPTRSEHADRFARRFWLLRKYGHKDFLPVAAILDMRGIVYSAQPPYKEIRFWERYQATHQINPLAAEVANICRR